MDNKSTAEMVLFSTPVLRVLAFLLEHIDEELIDTEIANRIEGVQKSAVNVALRRLAKIGVVERTPRGRMVFNRPVVSPMVVHLAVARNLAAIDAIVREIAPLCLRIVLFGSRAEGPGTSESDYDLFVVTAEEGKVRRFVRRNRLAESIQLVVKSPEDMLTFEKDEPVFAEEIKKGIILWQRT